MHKVEHKLFGDVWHQVGGQLILTQDVMLIMAPKYNITENEISPIL